MNHDVFLIIIGASIGLISSLLTSLFQSWLNKRDQGLMLEKERHQKLKQIIVPDVDTIINLTLSENKTNGVERKIDKQKNLLDKLDTKNLGLSKIRRRQMFILFWSFFLILATLIIDLSIYKAIIKSVITGIAVFLVFGLFFPAFLRNRRFLNNRENNLR